MKLPTIHLNGTSPEQLLEQAENVLRALHALDEAMASAAPNGRDYYTQGEEALFEAQREFRARREALSKLQADYEALYEHIQEAIEERERRRNQ